MIPVRLELQNFLAYRNPAPLEFEGLHVVCLAGANGAGKSSLLDAMTWALWGKARAKRDDDMIHAGESEMWVGFTFALDGSLYRVQRARKKGKRSISTLDLQILDDDLWRGIAEGSMRETQAKINRLLRLDYETFINSVFLLQGRADEFTTKTPAKRKEILAEILGLSMWEEYEERARAQLKTIEQEETALTSEVAKIDQELQSEEVYRTQLIEAQNEALVIGEQLRDAEAHMREVESARHELSARQQQAADLERRIAQGEGEWGELSRQMEEAQGRLATFDTLLGEQVDIEAGYGQLTAARAALDELGAKLMEQSDLLKEQNRLEATVSAAHNELQTEQRVLVEQIATLERTLAEEGEDEELVEVRERVGSLQKQQGELDDASEQLVTLREESAAFESLNRSLRTQMDILENQLQQVQGSDSPVCPLCSQALDEQHRAELLAQFEHEGNQHGEAWRANREQLDAQSEQAAELEGKITHLELELKGLPALQQRLAVLQERNQRDAETTNALEQQRSLLSGIDERLAGDDYAHEERQELKPLRHELSALGYDEEAHHAARETVEQYQEFEARHNELQQALAEMPKTQETLAALQERAANWETTLAEDRATQSVLLEEVVTLEERLEGAGQHEMELGRLQQAEADARVRVGAAEQRLQTLEDLRERRVDLTERQEHIASERSIYDQLREAFGRNGIPAMIIDAAIPELQETANVLLARMTEGLMHLQLSTQREKVTGGVAETLDIRISDGQNTRDYETFSGGEAMRINFALRIALSKLLARRAGAQLRTLVLDEGFGSQDAQGRERLMEAINSVQDDFDLILVITHIEELKDQFPARIEITKTPDGSQIELV